jgi:hypothetical protein
MAVDIQFIIDGQDRGQPLNAKDFGLTINENVDINARIVSFDNELIFGNDMYHYLFEKLANTGFCNLVEVEVNYECSDDWLTLTKGYIVVSECLFDLDKCQVKTKLYDDTFSTKINNNKSIPFSLSLTTTKNGTVIVPPLVFNGNFFNPADGVYDYEYVGVISVYEAFRHLITCMSDGLVDFESSYFFWEPTNNYLNTLIVTNGAAIRNRSGSETVISFEQLYIALKKKLNLGMAFERQSNGRPLLRIELESYFFQSGVNVNLYDQPSIELTFDKDRLYQAVNFGGDPFLEKEQCNNGSTACTFLQTPFRGFRDETFGFGGECNTSAILDLKSNDVIFDTNVIEDIFRFNIDTYDTNPVIVDADYLFGFPVFEMNKFDPYSLPIPQTVYNGSLRNINVSANWLNGFPNSLFSFLTSPTFPNSPSVQVRSNYSPNPTFAIQLTTFNSYLTETGLYVTFPTDVVNPFGYYATDSYTVPFTGIYTAAAVVCLGGLGGSAAGEHEGFVTIRHETSDETPIQIFNGTPIAIISPDGLIISHAATFLANAGDLIRVDVSARANFFDNGVPQPIVNSLFNVPTGQTIYTNLQVVAAPLNPDNPDEELDPVNIDDVRAYLYKFDRPLTMGEIQAILDNTSKPIAFGRHNDPLRVIEGFIKNITIPSVIRQSASIELKSNRLLR